MNHQMKRVALVELLLMCVAFSASSHSDKGYHARDMIDVLGFKDDNNDVWNWGKFISDNIDKIKLNAFYQRLQNNHPGFGIGVGAHRMLFHWGYNAEPWNSTLERYVRSYCKKNNLDEKKVVAEFKEEIRDEQKRRNKNMKFKTMLILKLDGKWANFFTSMAYNVHLLGDYTTYNTDLKGLHDFDSLIGLFVTDLRTIDAKESKSVINGMTRINKQNINVQNKADEMLAFMKKEVPSFIKNAQNGAIYRQLKGQGFYD